MNKTWIGLLGIAVAALVLRLCFCFYLGINQAPPAGSDDSDYARYAMNLAQGRGFRGPEPGSDGDVVSAYLPPGVPAFFAAIYLVAGESYAALRIGQCVIGAASVVLLYWVARSLAGELTAWFAAGMFAIWPSALFYCHGLLTETLYVLLVLLFALVCVNRQNAQSLWKNALLAGLVLGFTILVRPSILFFLPLFTIWTLFVMPGVRRGFLYGAIVGTAAACIVTPWLVRNYRVYHQFVLVSPVSWTVFIQGNNRIVATDPKLAGYCVWYTDIPEYADRFKGLTQIEREPVAKELALEWLGQNKDKWWYLVRNKFIRFWSPFLMQPSRLVRYTMLASWGTVLILMIPSILVTLPRYLRQRSPLLWVHLFIFAVMAQCVIYFALPRYRYPIEPFCMIFAAMTLVKVGFHVREATRSSGERSQDNGHAVSSVVSAS